MKRKIKRHRSNGGFPRTRAEAGERVTKICDGKRYRLRNGAIVIVRRISSRVSWAEVFPWTGQLEGHQGETMHWTAEGAYGANWIGHELDIMGPAK